MKSNELIEYLEHKEWIKVNENIDYYSFEPPIDLGFPKSYKIGIPINERKKDFNRQLNTVAEIISDIYDITFEDLNTILEGNQVFKIRIIDEDTKDGKINLNRFEIIIDKIKSILHDTASFVIDKNQLVNRKTPEAERYINKCVFLQTEVGSFISKIQLPDSVILKQKEVFNEEIITSGDVNQKLKEVLNFVNVSIFEDNIEATEDFIIENESLINLKLLKDIKTLYESANLKDVEFTFSNMSEVKEIKSKNVNAIKLNNLDNFVKKVESFGFKIEEFTFTGRVIELKSKNPEGLKNSIIMSGIHDGISFLASADLDSEQYKIANESHMNKTSITIFGKAKITKTKASFIDIKNISLSDWNLDSSI